MTSVTTGLDTAVESSIIGEKVTLWRLITLDTTTFTSPEKFWQNCCFFNSSTREVSPASAFGFRLVNGGLPFDIPPAKPIELKISGEGPVLTRVGWILFLVNKPYESSEFAVSIVCVSSSSMS